MKKTILLICAAALALVACDKVGTEVSDDASGTGGAKFRIAVNRQTKGAIWYGDEVNTNVGSNSLQVTAVASLHSKEGVTISNDVFRDPSNSGIPVVGYLTNVGSDEWVLTKSSYNEMPATVAEDDQLLLPRINDPRMNVLFLAAGRQDAELSNAVFMSDSDSDPSIGSSTDDSKWIPYYKEEADYTTTVKFFNVDTYAHPTDLMYASANEVRTDETRTVTLQHSQADLIFNLKVDPGSDDFSTFKAKLGDLSPSAISLLFITPDEAVKTTMFDGSFDLSTFAEGLSATDIPKYLPIKSVGTFTIDNSKNNIETNWDLSVWDDMGSYFNEVQEGIKDGKYVVLQNYPSDNVILGDYLERNYRHPNSDVFDVLATDYNNFPVLNDYDLVAFLNIQEIATGTTANGFVQVAEQLVPPQASCNPLLIFKFKGNTYVQEINLPKKAWQQGHYYIYNLKLQFTEYKFNIVVEEYKEGHADSLT